MIRFVALLFVLVALAGCVTAPEAISSNDQTSEPVAGEATPAPQSGARGGWAW